MGKIKPMTVEKARNERVSAIETKQTVREHNGVREAVVPGTVLRRNYGKMAHACAVLFCHKHGLDEKDVKAVQEAFFGVMDSSGNPLIVECWDDIFYPCAEVTDGKPKDEEDCHFCFELSDGRWFSM